LKIVFLSLFLLISTNVFAIECNDSKTISQAYSIEKEKWSTSIKLLTGLLEGVPIDGATPLESTKKLLLTKESEISDVKKKLNEDRIDFIYRDCLKDSKIESMIELDRLYDLRKGLLIKLLDLPFEKRNSLVSLYQVSTSQEAVTVQIKTERDEAIKAKEESDKQIEKAKIEAQKAQDAVQKALASIRGEIESYRSDLASKEIKWTTELELKSNWYLEKSKELASVNTLLLRGGSDSELLDSYRKVLELWRSMLSDTFGLLDRHKEFLQIPAPKAPGQPVALTAETEQTWGDITKSYEEADIFWQNLRLKTQQRLERELSLHYGLLLEASKLRSRLFDEGKRRGLLTIDLLSTDTLLDFKREFQIIPYRFIATFSVKWIGTKQLLSEGPKGVASVIKDIFLLLVVILIPLLMWKSTKKATEGFEKLRYNLLRKQWSSHKEGHFVFYLQKFVPYIPWLLGVVFLKIAQFLIIHTAFPELSKVLDYAYYLIWYNVFKLILTNLLSAVSLSANYSSNIELKNKVNRVSGIIGTVLFSSLATLELFEGVVGRGLIYNAIHTLLVYGGMVLLFQLATSWKVEIEVFFKRFSSPKTLEVINFLLSKKWSLVLVSLPLLLWIVFLHVGNQFVQWSSRFDFSKKISARLFKRRLESSEVEETGESIPPEYRKLFTYDPLDDEEFKIEPSLSLTPDLIEQVHSWSAFVYGEDEIEDETEVEEHSVAIYGPKGSGKSSLSNDLGHKLKDVEVITLKLNRRISSREKFLRFVSQRLNVELENGALDLRRLDSKLKKTVVIIDDAHNLFLSHVNGFDAYKTFLELINAQTRNIFWIAFFNDHAWNFLNNVFGRNQYFSSVLSMKKWKESDIQNMIMNRHKKSEFKLSFDEIINASRGQLEVNPYAHVETKFFRLLWEQSRGNPRVAIYLWLSSLSRKDHVTIKVGIPDDPETKYLTSLAEVSYFVYAEIVKHENMNSRELIQTSGLEEGIVRNALKQGLEGSFLYRSTTGRYRMTTRFQNDLISILKTKNMIYAIE